MGRFPEFSADLKLEIGPLGRIGQIRLDHLRSHGYPVSDMSQSLYRYYYYYGQLSSGRDGQAMGCRRVLIK